MELHLAIIISDIYKAQRHILIKSDLTLVYLT